MEWKPAGFSSCPLLDFIFMNFKMNVCNKADQLSRVQYKAYDKQIPCPSYQANGRQAAQKNTDRETNRLMWSNSCTCSTNEFIGRDAKMHVAYFQFPRAQLI